MFYEVIPEGKVERLTYRSDISLLTGQIVVVPVGKRQVPGVVVKKVIQPDFQCKPVSRIIYSKPLPRHLVLSTKFVHEYYLAPSGSVISLILPNGVEKKRRAGHQCPGVAGAGLGCGAFRSAAARELAREPRGDGSERRGPATSSAPAKTEQFSCAPVISLNRAQKNAIKGLQEARSSTKLLFGVTGSGKTNVYLHEAARALSEGKSVILLVPEIALTGQLVRVFDEVFAGAVTTIHSALSEAERHLIFERLLMGSGPRIVVGARSALFAPLDNLGLIIIDEEHESTYYQENSPKYSAIRVASFMAGQLKIPCILGSATPTVEDFYIATKRGSLVRLTEKAKDTAVRPEISIVDFKKRENFRKNRYFCDPLLAAIERNLKQGRQTLIFHNRRGSAPLTICESCGEEIECPNCFLPLTLHADGYMLRCHTCGFETPVPTCCPKCRAAGLLHKGFGTKLLESEIGQLFPAARVRRFDADTKKDESMAAIYSEVREGNIDILIGTQAIAKGLDLPRLATVGVVAADTGLSLPDFAAEERVFQLLTQVIGRVGRGHIDTAEVFVQTFRPDHPVLTLAMSENYDGFSQYLLSRRKEGGFPPFTHVARAEVTYKTEAVVLRKVREGVAALRSVSGVIVSPPTPAFHEHTARGYTWQIVVRARSRQTLVEALSRLGKEFRVAIDVPSLL